MKLTFTTIALLLLLAVLAGFVWHTTQTLPPVVASHFAANGAANGFMSRAAYMSIMLLLIVGTPLIVAFLPAMVIDKNGSNLNIPNREYWLTDDRREAAITFINIHSQWFAGLLATFLAYMHWLVVQANYIQPATLPISAILDGLIVFFVILTAWLVVLFRHFRIRS